MRGERAASASRSYSRCLLLAACTVGPDYQRPAAPVPVAYKEEAGWKRARPADAIDRGAWWSVFGDPVLDGLERQIDISNQNLKSAEAAFRQAEAIVAAGPRRVLSDRDSQCLGAALARRRHHARGRQGRLRQHLQFLQRHRVGELGPRSVGQRPPHRRKRCRERPGQRRRPGQRPARGAGPARQRLHAAAGRRRAEAAARCGGQAPYAESLRITAEPVQCRHRLGRPTWRRPAPSSKPRGPRRSRSASCAPSSSTRSPC